MRNYFILICCTAFLFGSQPPIKDYKHKPPRKVGRDSTGPLWGGANLLKLAIYNANKENQELIKNNKTK